MLAWMSVAVASVDTLYMEIAVSGVRSIPIGIVHVDFPSSQKNPLEEPIHTTLERDLFLSGRFAPNVLPQYDRLSFYRNRIAYYLSGSAQSLPGDSLLLHLRLNAVQSLAIILEQEYRVVARDFRQAVHHFSDQVIWQLSGTPGVAQSQIAWVSKIQQYKQLVMADYDGFNRKQITSHSSINMMPCWGKDQKSIFFVSFRNGTSQVFEKNLQSGRERPLFPGLGQSFSPAASPMSDDILFAVTWGGRSNIYKGNVKTRKAHKLTYQRSSETSPAWSPNGLEVLYSADRGGSPQVYMMDADGNDSRRVTFLGSYNESASWSPSGERIAYCSMDGGSMNIYTCTVTGEDVIQLTNQVGDNEHPVWSPDGMLIAFASNRTGSFQIYLMRKDGSGVTRITRGGENTWPSWAPLKSSKTQPQGGTK